MTNVNIVPASYKDPAGFVFTYNNQFYRQVNKVYAPHYDHLLQSGLYKILTEKKMLIEHHEVNDILSGIEKHYKTLLPTQLEFISYPYEWSFDMLKDAALLTLNINNLAMEHGMILKDATPFNIQFHNGKPLFIDTLSFEKYDETKPWIAYRQFCECFLFPLYISYYTKTDAQQWLTVYPNGINVSMTSSLLPWRSGFNLGVWLHVKLQRNISSQHRKIATAKIVFSKQKLIYLLDGLRTTIKNLNLNFKSTWSNYYEETILSTAYLTEKEKIFRQYFQQVSEHSCIDIGANDGYFSKIAAEKMDKVIAVDFDSNCINQFYKLLNKKKIVNILPLVIDITNPSPAIGFSNEERIGFIDRIKPTLILALAVIHHLAISKNLPLLKIAEFFSKISTSLIIEFVDKGDSKVKLLLENKPDIFTEYNEAGFEEAFTRYFTILKKNNVPGTERTLYLMSANNLIVNNDFVQNEN